MEAPDCMKLLEKYAGDASLKNDQGDSAISLGVKTKNEEVMKFLLGIKKYSDALYK